VQPTEKLGTSDKWDARGVAASNYINQSISSLSIGHSWDFKLDLGLPVFIIKKYFISLLDAEEVVSSCNCFNTYSGDPSSNLAPEHCFMIEGFSDFTQSLQENSMYYLKSDHERSIPYPSQIIIN
jgi:hypothetical protein